MTYRDEHLVRAVDRWDETRPERPSEHFFTTDVILALISTAIVYVLIAYGDAAMQWLVRR